MITPFLHGPVFELRFLHLIRTSEIWSYFAPNPCPPGLLDEILTHPKVQGFGAYFLLNELDPNRGQRLDILFRARKGQLTADKDIARRRWILFDSDSVKPTGAAATPEQHRVAHEHSAKLEAALTAEGWPRPIVCDSGNGAHRLYAVDRPNDRETAFLLSNLLNVTAKRFDTDAVKLDRTVWNAGRITRLYGSRNHKAGRDSAVLSVPSIVPVTLEQIQAVVTKWRGALGYKKPLVARVGDWTPERVQAFLSFHDIDYRPPTEIPSGILWVLSPCPLNDEHVGTSPGVILTKSGWPKFRCMHNSCSGIKWADFRKRLYVLTGKWFLND
jgi:hypothetical protein